jgi:hypothetical protein
MKRFLMVLGIITLALFLITLLPLRGPTASPESWAFSSIRILSRTMEEQKSKTGRYPKSLAELSPELPEDLKNGVKQGYRFSISGDGTTYAITAVPIHYGGNTKRSFYFDLSSIRVSSRPEPANSGSPELTFDSNQ